ncbi:single-stranded DNA-binding protein [Acaryochloris marina]|uniref:Single-stranded DNA-binding protein n=1 Tax=Acaryochloris marina (strain MBIC 11017) TaxID=329726 RepID=A8ZME5_ACAM1|nr:single-stranded DNA-binding protein [Acaryochloris marina]ABW32356.1 single-stranded DNA-binding protein [Acaryochloris marina MBIC11017]
MNTCTFQGILLERSLRYTQERRAIAEFVVEINPLMEEDPKENLKAIYWGENGEQAHNALQAGDQLVLQGQLRINKVTHRLGNEEYVEQQASVIVEKINRIQSPG